MKRNWFRFSLVLLLMMALNVQLVQADSHIVRTHVPIGSDYRAETLQSFALSAAQRDTDGVVEILVIPITFSLDAFRSPNGERQKNLDLADTRRGQVETACDAVKLAGQTCHVVLAPVLVRADAYLQSNLDLFVPDLDGMYILGGDQTVAMQVVANTPFEERMTNAFDLGAVVGGNSAGAAVQSRNMIGGYVGNFGPENGFQQGIVDIWSYEGPTDDRRGLNLGISNAVFEQHTMQRGRLARLINTSFTTGLLGIGMDAGTGATITDESMLSNVTGETVAAIVDLQTYNAAGNFGGPTNSLAIHGLTTHIIPPGDFGYDLVARQPLVDGSPLPAPAIAGRTFDALHLPAGYGPLLLSGDLSGDPGGSAAQRFVSLSGGTNARLVVLTFGYVKSNDSRSSAKAFASALQPFVTNPVQWIAVDSRVDQQSALDAIANATGILISAPDQSTVMNALSSQTSILAAVQSAWAAGKVLLADNAAAAALGEAVSVDPTPTSSSLESDSMGDFLFNGVTIQPGLNWIPGIAVEPRMVIDRHWGRLYNHLHRNSSLLGLGVDVNTAVEFTATGANVWGKNTVVVFDGRYGSYGLGTNGALSANYVVLDTYIEGDTLLP